MKQITLFAFTFLLCFNGIGQDYWQQEVNYKIDVTLDDVKHEITAFEEFEYINNSPSSLDFIYIHLFIKHIVGYSSYIPVFSGIFTGSFSYTFNCSTIGNS